MQATVLCQHCRCQVLVLRALCCGPRAGFSVISARHETSPTTYCPVAPPLLGLMRRQVHRPPTTNILGPYLTHFDDDVFCQELAEARTGSATRREYTAYLAGRGRKIRVPTAQRPRS